MKKSWISPTFGDGDELPATAPPSKKRHHRLAPDRPPSPSPSASASASVAGKQCDWLQKHRPKGVADLAPNAKKVKEVEAWLADARSRLLLLTGPAGCGKTATLLALCRSKGIRLAEWVTPLDRPDGEGDEFARSGARRFEEYLLRSSRYASCLGPASAARRVVLVKDFPNAFLRDPPAFHELLSAFAAKCVQPVVFVCGDDALCRKLFPADVKHACRVQTVAFNPLTDRTTFRVLKTVLARENVRTLSDEAVNAVSTVCRGDLRSAITTLHFHAVNSDFDLLKTGSKLKKASSPDDSDPFKDNRLDFFRGVGRVLFPKRIETPGRLTFVHSPDGVVDSFAAEPDGFLGQLHENYPSKLGDASDLAEAARRLAAADLLLSRWQERDAFRTYALSVAVRGLMVGNRRPQRGRFEPFRRAATARCRTDAKALELEGRALFADLRLLDHSAALDVLPFAAALLPGLNPSQSNYIQRTCRFKPS